MATTKNTPSLIPHRILGSTDAEVSIMGLGGYHLGTIASKREAVRIVQAAVEAGITFMDNAWEYHDGREREAAWARRSPTAGARRRLPDDQVLHARPRQAGGAAASSTSRCAG